MCYENNHEKDQPVKTNIKVSEALSQDTVVDEEIVIEQVVLADENSVGIVDFGSKDDVADSVNSSEYESFNVLPSEDGASLVNKSASQQSQYTDSTVTLSHPSQDLINDSQESLAPKYENKSCQTDEIHVLSEAEYCMLLSKAKKYSCLQNGIIHIRNSFLSRLYNPNMDPCAFESFCKNVGAGELYVLIYNSMVSERMSENRKLLNKKRTMVIIYMMLYGYSQKCNWFQVNLSRTLHQFGVSERGLASLMNLGIAAHPHTVKAAAKTYAVSQSSELTNFFAGVIEKNQFIAIFIDDYHNIHTRHRPNSSNQTQSIHMATLLVKVFPNIKAVRIEAQQSLLSDFPVQIGTLKQIVSENISMMSKTFAQVMPDWIVAEYFDPQALRHRLAVHDYRQTEIYQMRRMDNCKLVDCIEIPL